jgi:ABC-type molybdate transport system permease subunit
MCKHYINILIPLLLLYWRYALIQQSKDLNSAQTRITSLLIFPFNLTAVSGTIAVIIFGAYGDGRDWMQNWEHNNIAWSYAFAVFGVLFLYISGILYLIEGRVHHKKRQRAHEATHSAYHMEQRKGHTAIWMVAFWGSDSCTRVSQYF